jgi:hypothetical protein
MPYGSCVTDVLGVADELGVMGYVVAKVVGWFLEFCENLAKPLATSSPTMFLVSLSCSENIAETSSEVTEVDGCDSYNMCTSLVESIGQRTGSLIYMTKPRLSFT